MHHPFRFGVVASDAPSRAAWIALARRAEELGYATLLVPDRIGTGLAPLTALAVAASATTTLRIGSHMFCNDYRHPALLAREVATLDLLSEGRFELGIGAGVGPTDYQQMGLAFDEPGTRVARLEEALLIIQQFFTEEVVNFTGKHYTITDMRGLPKPIQRPHPPIFIGTSGKRMLSIAARQANIIAVVPRLGPQGADPNDATPEQKLAWVREAAGERFDQLELAQTGFPILITDGRNTPIEQARHMPSFIPRLQMSVEQAVEHLLQQRERYGYSYIQVSSMQMESFAPVVARLNGK